MSLTKNNLTVCYFGIFNPDFSRNKVYINGLRKRNIKVLICNDDSKGLKKYPKLIKKHWPIRKDYDVMIVGFHGSVIMPLAKIISRKKIIYDAFFSVYEAEVISRGKYKNYNWRYWYIKFIDNLAVKLADSILVESEAQKEYFINKFKIKAEKINFIYTGIDEDQFFYNKIKKFEKFTVLFRGYLTPEAGVIYILKAAKILEEENIDFLIIGLGFMEKAIKAMISSLNLRNVKLISEYLDLKLMIELMLKSHISLGQFENNERLSRTIPHKAFESLALKLPYITGRAAGIGELLEDGISCLMVNLADPEDLASKIMELKNNQKLAKKITENGYNVYRLKFTSEILIDKLLKIIYSTIKKV